LLGYIEGSDKHCAYLALFYTFVSNMEMDAKCLRVDNAVMRLWIMDGIVFCEYKPNLYIDMEVAKLLVEARKSATKSEDFPALIDVRNLKRIEEDARKYLASDEAAENVKALAVIKEGFITNLLANWYLKIDRPPFPTRLYEASQMKMAVRWLELFKTVKQN